VARLPFGEGSKIELERVLMVGEGDGAKIGAPLVDGAKVLATVLEQGRTRKVVVFKYKPKVRYRRKLGHRQHYTRLLIDEIVAG
jgi:large subunit ribosomal protein L21